MANLIVVDLDQNGSVLSRNGNHTGGSTSFCGWGSLAEMLVKAGMGGKPHPNEFVKQIVVSEAGLSLIFETKN